MGTPSSCKLYTDVTTLPEKDKISPQSLQRKARGGQVSEEGNGTVWTRNLQRKKAWLLLTLLITWRIAEWREFYHPLSARKLMSTIAWMMELQEFNLYVNNCFHLLNGWVHWRYNTVFQDRLLSFCFSFHWRIMWPWVKGFLLGEGTISSATGKLIKEMQLRFFSTKEKPGWNDTIVNWKMQGECLQIETNKSYGRDCVTHGPEKCQLILCIAWRTK